MKIASERFPDSPWVTSSPLCTHSLRKALWGGGRDGHVASRLVQRSGIFPDQP